MSPDSDYVVVRHAHSVEAKSFLWPRKYLAGVHLKFGRRWVPLDEAKKFPSKRIAKQAVELLVRTQNENESLLEVLPRSQAEVLEND